MNICNKDFSLYSIFLVNEKDFVLLSNILAVCGFKPLSW